MVTEPLGFNFLELVIHWIIYFKLIIERLLHTMSARGLQLWRDINKLSPNRDHCLVVLSLHYFSFFQGWQSSQPPWTHSCLHTRAVICGCGTDFSLLRRDLIGGEQAKAASISTPETNDTADPPGQLRIPKFGLQFLLKLVCRSGGGANILRKPKCVRIFLFTPSPFLPARLWRLPPVFCCKACWVRT